REPRRGGCGPEHRRRPADGDEQPVEERLRQTHFSGSALCFSRGAIIWGLAMSDRPAPRTVYLETFGCQMNVLDSQLVRGQLLGLGYRFVEDWRQADVVLYNTCSVREHAENKVWSRVGLVGIRKRENPG